MADLLSNIQSGAGSILRILEGVNNAFSPSARPISDPALEEAAGPEATARARELHQRAYNAQRARAIEGGASVFNMDALASEGLQDQYSQNLARSAQALDMLRERRSRNSRLDALQELIAGIADPSRRALAAANPEGYADAAIKDQFRPETENFAMTAIGEGAFVVLDKRTGKREIVENPAIAEALRSGLGTVQETNDGRLVVFNKRGQVINEIAGGEDPKVEAQRQKDLIKRRDNLRKEFDTRPEVEDYRRILPLVKSIENAPDTAPGDLDYVYAIGKIFDPNSVVKESEMQLVLNSAPATARLLAQWGFQMDGKARLTPEMRERIRAVVNNRAAQLRTEYDTRRGQYTTYATQGEMDPFDVVGPDPLAAFNKQKQSNDAIEYVRDASGKLVRK